MKKNHRIAPDLKEQILKRIKEEGVPISQAAKDHGIHETTKIRIEEAWRYHPSYRHRRLAIHLGINRLRPIQD